MGEAAAVEMGEGKAHSQGKDIVAQNQALLRTLAIVVRIEGTRVRPLPHGFRTQIGGEAEKEALGEKKDEVRICDSVVEKEEVDSEVSSTRQELDNAKLFLWLEMQVYCSVVS